jgi:hypothetical protein
MRCHPLAALVLRALALTLGALCVAGPAAAQPPVPSRGDEAERERAFVEAMRREDPAAADRFVALRDARAQALAELRKIESQYNAAGSGVQGVFVRSLLQARKKYAETSLALLDFFDARDREVVARYQDEIGKINAIIEERKKTRAEFEKLLTPER